MKIVAIVCILVSLAGRTRASTIPNPPASRAGDPVIAAAGDIACDPFGMIDKTMTGLLGWCRMAQTARLIKMDHVAAVLALGDEQYQSATPDDFAYGYALTWGAFESITRPTPGNHEYYTPGAAGYFGYFGKVAGDPERGYYSFDIGSWHMISLNGNCAFVGGCGAGSAQELWLRSDLASHRSPCTLAYWHEPRFSSGGHHSDTAYEPFWQDLYAAGADVALAGHDHDYERFAPQTPDGSLDESRGIREFVVGTGGKSHDLFGRTVPNSLVRNWTTYGVLLLTLHPHGYDWRFQPIAGETFTDSGSALCHGHQG
jgi:calcineurin-like phosphoesterase family protein